MKRQNLTVLLLLVLCGGGLGVFWFSLETPARGETEVARNQAHNPLLRINEKAKLARGSNEDEVRAVADEVFSTFNFDQAPAGMDDAIKARLVRAEINYRMGHGKGSASEFRVVHMVNLLAHRLGAPAYVRTNAFEVRRLRMDLLPYTSDLQSSLSRNDEKGPKKLGDLMSPLEAFFIAMSLVQQKRYNAEFQLTNKEWIALHGGKRTAKANQAFLDVMKNRRSDSSRADEVERAVRRGFTAMTPYQMLSLPDELLNTLGIEH
jgi:hypothetical protein